MNHAQKYLAQANRHIAELNVQVGRQRVIVKDALGTGQRSEIAESLLDALEGSLRIFEKHRIFLLSCSPANNGQQGKSPGSEAGARLGFDGSNNNSRALSPRRYRSSRQAMLAMTKKEK
jgi:hypothetical protein